MLGLALALSIWALVPALLQASIRSSAKARGCSLKAGIGAETVLEGLA